MKDWVKRGFAELAATGRQGLDELSQVLPAFPSQGIQPVAEPGTFGVPTSQEVTAARSSDSFEAEVQQAAHAAKDARAPERGKDLDLG
ncbi:unnamed protein product [Gemmata massiliana]|uniref:Uncharacterized protein n=1 Tax=Gemmata massiliana TaxID=1210884 RepID=A0A6P2CST9_9BACT|nr:hypothetical protein [Gemmata massiliana]VTR91677.1 unnamed protein product [Gemmata massiliana]